MATNKAILVYVEETDGSGPWPVHVVLESGTEIVKNADDLGDVERIAKDHGIKTDDIAWRGASRVQIRAGLDPSRP